jgi:aminobenzoyl-glutamate utilization protein B
LAHVAKAMAGTALDAIRDETLLARARAEHRAKLQQTPYVSPLPEDAKPALDMSRQVA